MITLYLLGWLIGPFIFIAVLANSKPNWQPLYDELRKQYQNELRAKVEGKVANYETRKVAGCRSMNWKSVGAGGGGYYQCVATAPGDPNRVYCGIDVGGIYRSDDGGQTWVPIYAALRRHTQLAQCPLQIAVSYQDPNVFYLITKNAGIWRTNDGGMTYYPCGQVKETGGYHDGQLITISPVNHDHASFFAARSFWWTQDGGLTLTAFSLSANLTPPVATAVHVNADGVNLTFWCGSAGKLSRVSTGETAWTTCKMHGFPTGGFMATEMTGRPVHSSVDWETTKPVLLALARADGKAYSSRDLGDTWFQVPNSPATASSTLWVDPLDCRRMFVNEHPLLGFATDDGGQSGWAPQIASMSRRAEQMGAPEMHGYEYVPGDPAVVYGREGYSLYKSDDGGHTFHVVSQLRFGVNEYGSTGSEATFANWLAVTDDGTVYLSDQDCGLARSDNNMQTWHCLRYGTTEPATSDHPTKRGQSIWNCDSVSGMVFEAGKVYAWICGRTVMQSELEEFAYIWSQYDGALKERHSIYVSYDGANFEPWSGYKNFPWQWNGLSGNLIRGNDGMFWLCVPAGIFRSPDAKTWTNLTPKISNVPAYTNLYNWQRQPALFGHVRVDPLEPKRVYVTAVQRVNQTVKSSSTLSAICKSEDGGNTFNPVTSPIKSCWALECSPVVTGMVWAADRDTGLYLSQDAGATWEKCLTQQRITAIVPGPIVYTDVMVAADAGYQWSPVAGVYLSHDLGKSWESQNHNLPHWRIMFMRWDHGDVYLGTRGGGAFVWEP